MQDTPLYIASGLLSYNDTRTMDLVMSNTQPFSSQVHYKELHLTREELDMLSVDQQSGIDFLVLARSVRFVGIGSSTFSWFVREFRGMQGAHEHTSLFVSLPAVPTDYLFEKGARLPKIDRIFRSATLYSEPTV